MNLETFLENPEGIASLSGTERDALQDLLRAHAIEAGHLPRDLIPLAMRLSPRVELTLEGLRVCAHPAGEHLAMRILRRADIPKEHAPSFAAPGERDYAVVFVDPQALSYRNFENILPLDDHFKGVRCTLQDHETVQDVLHTLRLRGPTARLKSLHDAGLYVAPLNAGQRGGRRFIFHAEPLARALTRALRMALPADLLERFVGVNPVFRMSEFTPAASPFQAHLDAPYRDASRDHISRYTLLLYVTGGVGTPALEVAGVALDDIDAMTCVIFDQRHEHHGQPYLNTDKVFVRTELIFEEPGLLEAPSIGRAFARAIYLTGDATRDPSLAEDEHQAYDRASRAHWEGVAPRRETEVFFHRQFQGADYVANGYDFWFRGVTLQEAASLVILDHFNCTLQGRPFRRHCASTKLERSSQMSWVPEFLRHTVRVDAEPLSATLPKASLFPAPEAPEPGNTLPEIIYDHNNRGDYDDPSRNARVIALYEAAQDKARASLMLAPIYLMGQELFLDMSRFVVEGERIHILSNARVEPVHFAAMYSWEVDPPHFVAEQHTFQTLHPLVPPILWRRVDGCWHLRLDFFRNTWMVDLTIEEAIIPSIRMF